MQAEASLSFAALSLLDHDTIPLDPMTSPFENIQKLFAFFTEADFPGLNHFRLGLFLVSLIVQVPKRELQAVRVSPLGVQLLVRSNSFVAMSVVSTRTRSWFAMCTRINWYPPIHSPA